MWRPVAQGALAGGDDRARLEKYQPWWPSRAEACELWWVGASGQRTLAATQQLERRVRYPKDDSGAMNSIVDEVRPSPSASSSAYKVITSVVGSGSVTR